ncbi:hypothetical protein NDN08_006217 [Rhodosorus marinus]|uniref:Arrestin-like N-terminal domain-containing protein n=1 Tax=Rhodosorus marinus TaxID=101924 RepID=A0AAV8UNL5_9RHOD|nr:hypothetical protein NDN08_006217 [Rhodosorus marinus]
MDAEFGDRVQCEVTSKLKSSWISTGSQLLASVSVRIGTGSVSESASDVTSARPASLLSAGSRGGYSAQFNVKRCVVDDTYFEEQELGRSEVGANEENKADESRRRKRLAEFTQKQGMVKLSYIVCEVSGRWICDSAWVAQDAHESSKELEDIGRYGDVPWAGALDDASHYGGGGKRGYSGFIFRSKPHIIATEEKVLSGSQTIYDVSCEFPETLPPSLRGTAVRYSYALAIVVSFDSCTPKSLRIPIRVVLSSPPADEIIPVPYTKPEEPERSQFQSKCGPTDPLTMRSHSLASLPPHDVDLALALSVNGRLTPYRSDNEIGAAEDLLSDQESLMMSFRPQQAGARFQNGGVEVGTASPSVRTLDSVQEPRSARDTLPVYVLKKGNKKIGRLFLPKTVHELGETLTAIFDFSEGEIPCYRLIASLEMKEIVNPAYALGSKDRPAKSDEYGRTFKKVYGEHSEYVSQALNTYLVLSIPRDAAVCFQTSAVKVMWELIFAFYTPSDERIEQESTSRTDESWYIPEKETEVLNWTLPLDVVGPSGDPSEKRAQVMS